MIEDEEDDIIDSALGPIQFGKTFDPPLEKGFLDKRQEIFVKVERVTLAVIFFLMMCLCGYNVYFYLYRAKMYRSYPLIFAYIIVAVFSFMGIFYELYMGFHCGGQDCFTHLLIAIMPEYSFERRNEEHQNYLKGISILWKIRQ